MCYPSLDPPNILIKASLNRSEAGRELGRDPPPAALALPGERNVGDSGGDLVSGANSAEGGREGLGVMTLKKKMGIDIVMSLSSTEAPAGYPIKTVIIEKWQAHGMHSFFPSPCLPTTQKEA